MKSLVSQVAQAKANLHKIRMANVLLTSHLDNLSKKIKTCKAEIKKLEKEETSLQKLIAKTQADSELAMKADEQERTEQFP